MSSATDSVGSVIDSRFAQQVDFLAQLVCFPSSNPPGDTAAHATRTAQLLRSLGLHVECHDVPTQLARQHGLRSVTNLVVRHRFGSGPTIALNAHGDVVAPGNGWSVDPYGAVVRDGTMYGRGVAVSKSDITTYGFALHALIESGVPLAGAVEIHVTYDEETGGALGPQWLLEQGLSKPDYAICAGFTYNVCIAHNGCLHLQITVRGRSAHAAMPDSGIDALEAATQLLQSLYELRRGYKLSASAYPGITHPTLVVGLINGGINTNVVPDAVTLRLDRRVIPEEDPAQVERELVGHVQSTCRLLGGVSLEIERLLLAYPLTRTTGQDRLLHSIQVAAKEVLGEEVPATAAPIYTDARHYRQQGIPTVLYGAGPREMLEANAHRADERLKLDDLLRATKVVALAVADLLQTA